MKYRVEHLMGLYVVVEMTTDQSIAEFLSKDKALKMMRELERGNGFDGWTPSFFTKPQMLRGD